MKQIWNKIGRIFDPSVLEPYGYSFSSVPFVNSITKNHIEIYFSSRDNSNKSHLLSATFNINNNFSLLEFNPTPLLSPGGLGEFDEHGVMGCHSMDIEGSKYLYYIGWNLGVTTPFRNSIGLAKYSNNQWVKKFKGPLLDRSIYDACFVASNDIIKIKDQYVMYYLSCDSWENINDKLTHKYNIKIATSLDGIKWERNGDIAIDYQNSYEYAFSTPRVIKDLDTYKMWYSYRASKENNTYRIGYSESLDGFNWVRKDCVQSLTPSIQGWDSEMVCYPFIFKLDNSIYMLYNGNQYGQTGIGLAKLN